MDLKEISFSGKTCYNICSDAYKKGILEHLFNKYQIVITHKNFKFYDDRYRNYLVKKNYLLSVKTIGNPYYLFLTKDSEGNNICIFIDKKIIKGYNYPRMIYIIYRFSDHIFNDTLFEGELLRRDNMWTYIINNVHVYQNKNVVYENFLKKLSIIENIMSDHYERDDIISPCPIKIKKYYTYNQISEFNKDIEGFNFDIGGYFMTPLDGNHPTLYFQHQTNKFNGKLKAQKQEDNTGQVVKKQITQKQISQPQYLQVKKIERNNDGEYIAYMKITRTQRPGIYQLYCEKNGKIIKHSIARVETLDMSKILRENITQEGDFSVKCKYNSNFSKWCPIEWYPNCDRVDNYNDILEMIK